MSPPRPACVEAPLARRLGPHQRDPAISTPHRLVAQRPSAVRERADVHARASTARMPAPDIFERRSTNRCPHVPSGTTCWRHLRASATGSIAVPSPPQIPLPCRAHQSECGRTPPARGRHHWRDRVHDLARGSVAPAEGPEKGGPRRPTRSRYSCNNAMDRHDRYDAWTWTHGHGRLRPQQPLTLSRDFLSTLVTARSVVLSFLPEFRRVVWRRSGLTNGSTTRFLRVHVWFCANRKLQSIEVSQRRARVSVS